MKKSKRLFIMIVVIICLPIYIIFLMIYYGMTNIRPKEKKAQAQNIIKVACIGDSITYGMMVANWNKNTYPRVLEKMLGPNYLVKNFGVSNTTAVQIGNHYYINEKIYQESLDFNADIVIIMFGTNDSKSQNWISKEVFKQEYQRFINTYRVLTSTPKIVVCTPCFPFEKEGRLNYGIQSTALLEIRDAILEITIENGFSVIDMYVETKEHVHWFSKDGVHPNMIGAKHIAKIIYSHITPKIDTSKVDRLYN